jgi:peptide deformylase
MKTTVKVLILICAGYLFASCKSQLDMTKEEINLITSGAPDQPFRVLQTTNLKDSLFLREKCKNIRFDAADKTLQRLIERLKATLAVESGVGIAAPQVNIGRNIFLFMRIDRPGQPIEVAINPRIVSRPDETICFERDGCLSIPNTSGNSIRYPWVEVEYTNEKGELIRERLEGYSRKRNYTGIIFQHEYDHLQGILFIDKLCITK